MFVSGAAGAVGSQVGQIARLKGASRVIGSAGSDEKVKCLVDELGFDAAFNYKKGPVLEQLRAAAPDGIDVYFDNVGGDHLEAAISMLNVHGRATLCGVIARYNDTEPTPGPCNMVMVIGKRLRSRASWSATTTACRAVRRRGRRLAGVGRAQVQRDVRRGHRERRGRLPRHAARREHRQDGRHARRVARCPRGVRPAPEG